MASRRPLLAAFFLAVALPVSFATSPGALADDDARPDREAYASALERAYSDNLSAAGATEKELRKFGDCIVEATYASMSAGAITAIVADDGDYVLSDEDATAFFEATNDCLDKAGIADLLVEDANTHGGVGESPSPAPGGSSANTGSETPAQAATPGGAGTFGGATSKAEPTETGHSAGQRDQPAQAGGEAAASETPASTAAPWKTTLAIGLLVAAILLGAGGLVLVNRPKMKASREAQRAATDTGLDGLLR